MYFRKQGISICQNPEGALKFLAWLWGSQENYLFCLYGEEARTGNRMKTAA